MSKTKRKSSFSLAKIPERQIITGVQYKVCHVKGCYAKGNPQPIENFSPQHQLPDGHHSWCKNCCNRIAAEKRDLRKAEIQRMRFF